MNSIIVYTYGRVGSTSIYKSINTIEKSFHFHNLVPGFKQYIQSDDCPCLDYYLKNHQIKIISGVREPVSRTISAFFTWMDKIGTRNDYSQYSGYSNYYLGDREDIIKKNIDIIIEKFFEALSKDDIFDPLESWFDKNIKKYFEIDVYNEKFDQDQGFCQIDKGNHSLFLYRQEDLKNNVTGGIKDFLGIKSDDFYIQQHNQSSNNWNSDIYREFKNNIKFDIKHLEKIYCNKKFRHFYSEKNIENFINAHIC